MELYYLFNYVILQSVGNFFQVQPYNRKYVGVAVLKTDCERGGPKGVTACYQLMDHKQVLCCTLEARKRSC